MKRGTISINDNNIHIELVEGTVWVTKSEIARLLDVFVQTVSTNVREIFKNKELFEHEVTRRDQFIDENGLESITELYNLDVIISLAFRMKGGRCRLFREWVREQIKQSIRESRKTPLIIQLGNATFIS